MKALLVALMMFVSACAHDVYSYDVDQNKRDRIDIQLAEACGTKCWVDQCWQETQNATFCNVRFSFTSDRQQEATLAAVAKKLSSPEEPIGFCGRDSPGTVAVQVAAAAVVVILIAAIIAGGNHSHGSSGNYYFASSSPEYSPVTATTYEETPLRRACLTPPRAPRKKI